MTLEEMLKTPGHYLVTRPGAGYCTRVEVDDQQRCHQLNHLGERDGILHPDGWSRDVEVWQR